ncbi:MAG: hypothetical protein M1817_000197 [Caeruleum heppii]|nr:MAG: hypothetical protein M1817_000197 [Caeruleum heppii]
MSLKDSELAKHTSTVILLTVKESAQSEIGTGAPWQKTFEAISKEPNWRFTTQGRDDQRPAFVMLTIGWKDGIVPEAFQATPEEAVGSSSTSSPRPLSILADFLLEAPDVLNIAFCYPGLSTPGWGLAMPPYLAELMVLRVPLLLQADCNAFADEVGRQVFHDASTRFAHDVHQGALPRCAKGWETAERPPDQSRRYVLIWFWASLEERARYKDPNIHDTGRREQYYGSWYRDHVENWLARLESQGGSVQSQDLKIDMARKSNGRRWFDPSFDW